MLTAAHSAHSAEGCHPGTALVCELMKYADCFATPATMAQYNATGAVVRTNKEDVPNDNRFCNTASAFYVGNGLFVTADHAISAAGSSILNTLGVEFLEREHCSTPGAVPEHLKLAWREVGVEVVYDEYFTNPPFDIAFFRIKGQWTQPGWMNDLDFDFDGPTKNERAYLAGYPSFNSFRDSELHLVAEQKDQFGNPTDGTVKNTTNHTNDSFSPHIMKPTFKTDMGALNGFSGSPLLRWSDQAALGVLTNADCNESKGVGARHILMHLQENGVVIEDEWHVGTSADIENVGEDLNEAYWFTRDAIYEGNTTRFANSTTEISPRNHGRDVWFRFPRLNAGEYIDLESDFPAALRVHYFKFDWTEIESARLTFNGTAWDNHPAGQMATKFSPTNVVRTYGLPTPPSPTYHTIVIVDGTHGGAYGKYALRVKK